MVMRWIVKGFAMSRGSESVIDEWEQSTTPKAVAKFDQRLNFLKDRPISEWTYDYAHRLTTGDGVWEIKFEWMNVAYRPLFYLGPYPDDLTILFFAQERGGKWRPPNSLVLAKSRMLELTKNPNKALMYDG